MRSTISLDGPWTFRTDPQSRGVAEGWPRSHGFSRTVELPGPWQLYGGDMVAYAGHAWYQRSFVCPPEWRGGEVVVRFDAVDYETTAWLNGERLGSHEGGYTPFEFLLPGIRPGEENHLVLRVWDPLDNAEIPHGKQGSWYTRVSGPWQPLRLEYRPTAHIRRLHVTPSPQAEWADVAIQATPGQRMTLRLTDADGHLVTETATDGDRVRLSVPRPRLWSPESPHLYTLQARLGDDEQQVSFGMRWIEVRDRLIHLNGQPLYIRGALDQAFWPQTIYRPGSIKDIESEIRQAQAMGINLLRKHIKLEDPRSLDACDRLGMLVWEEPACFSRWTLQARQRFRREVEQMIERDYNHPSVIIWTLYNEEWGLEWTLRKDSEKQAHVAELYAHARALDPSRLICDNSGWAHVHTDINDFHRYHALPELMPAWQADIGEMLEEPEKNFVPSRQEQAAGVPVIVSEFGMWGLPEMSRLQDSMLQAPPSDEPRAPAAPEVQGNEAHYGRQTLALRPWWFDAQWSGHVEEFKYPVTAERNFFHFQLEPVFGDLDGLGRACQKRMMRGVKATIEAMRLQPELAGWVVTELTDIEWESNGWLDYYRRPKAHADQFAWFHGPLAIILAVDRHNAWEGEVIHVRAFISNHSAREGDAVLRWWVNDEAPSTVPISVRPWTTVEVTAFPLPVPATQGCVRAILHAALELPGRPIVVNQEELTFSGRPTVPEVAIAVRHGATQLKLGGSQELSPDLLLLTTQLDPEAESHMAAGGHVLMLVPRGDEVVNSGNLSLHNLSAGESWDRASSVLYWRPEAFPSVPCEAIIGWECEGIFPQAVIPITNYLHYFGGRGIEQVSNQCNADPQGILAGYFEGWLGKFAATVLVMPYEAGQLTVCTFRLLDTYGTHPVATMLLHDLFQVARQKR